MKKIIFKTLMITVSLMMAYSCSDDLLDTTSLDEYSENIVWSDAAVAQGFVYNTCYEVTTYFLEAPAENSSYLASGGDDFTDNMASWKTNESSKIGKSTIDRYYDAGWSKFDLIRQANMIIEKSKASKTFTDAIKTNFEAQGRMLRAMIYYKQARKFGKCVLIDKVLNTTDSLKIGRSSIKDTYDFILADLDFAAANLPSSGVNGKLTKGLALAMKAEVALQGAAYLEEAQEQKDYYTQSVEASETLFTLGYSMDPDYKSLFNDYAYAESSKEIIFAMWRSSDVTLFKNTPMQQMVPNCETDKLDPVATPRLVENFVGWPRRCPTWDLTTDYLVVDKDGVAKKYNETSYYNDWLTNGGFVSSFLWKNRDARFEASIAHDSTYLFNNLITTRDSGNCDRKMQLKGTANSSRTGFWMRKGVYEQEPLFAKNPTSYHSIICRLGRSYLNYAEALLRLNRTSEAVTAINETRVNHGDLPALSTSVSESDAWKYYKIERRVELFYECGDRYWSLIRWAKADKIEDIQELNHGIKYMEISADGKSYEIQQPWGDASANALSWLPKRFLFPVPEKQIELNENLDQNPGW